MTTARHSQGTAETALPSTTKESQALCRARAAVLFSVAHPPEPLWSRMHRTRSARTYLCARVLCTVLYCMWDRRSLRERLVSCTRARTIQHPYLLYYSMRASVRHDSSVLNTLILLL